MKRLSCAARPSARTRMLTDAGQTSGAATWSERPSRSPRPSESTWTTRTLERRMRSATRPSPLTRCGGLHTLAMSKRTVCHYPSRSRRLRQAARRRALPPRTALPPMQATRRRLRPRTETRACSWRCRLRPRPSAWSFSRSQRRARSLAGSSRRWLSAGSCGQMTGGYPLRLVDRMPNVDTGRKPATWKGRADGSAAVRA
mmetsp:Transcript_11702/g.37085  ORF Transcript_11702/g.37085 Transcript_11702/m.37085 type:complete len:200 (+) Transcript_11702:229-828(+)